MSKGIYEAWKLPGGPETEGTIGALEAKAIGASIFIGSSVRKFKIDHHDNWGDERFPWRLKEWNVVGTRDPIDEWELFDEFATLREAIATARRLARASMVDAKAPALRPCVHCGKPLEKGQRKWHEGCHPVARALRQIETL